MSGYGRSLERVPVTQLGPNSQSTYVACGLEDRGERVYFVGHPGPTAAGTTTRRSPRTSPPIGRTRVAVLPVGRIGRKS
jgi:hypothetical protein